MEYSYYTFFALIRDSFSRKRVHWVVNKPLRSKIRRICVGHELFRCLQITAAVEILDHEERSKCFAVKTSADVILDYFREVLKVVSVIRDDYDPRVVVAAVCL